jgi:periplasmic divalent cation tolerance protein
MFVAWTTLDDQEIAEQMAFDVVAESLAVCGQVDITPVISVYRWEGETQSAREYRVVFKCTEDQLDRLEQWVLGRHPYETPEWIVLKAERVGEKYLSWAGAAGTFLPFNESKPSL